MNYFNSYQILKLTVNAGQFSSQTSGDAFGISWIAVGDTSVSFFDTYLLANSIEFKISRIHHVNLIQFNSENTYGQFGSTLWSTWSEKAKPSENKTTNLIFEYLIF